MAGLTETTRKVDAIVARHPKATVVFALMLIFACILLFISVNLDFNYTDKNNNGRLTLSEVSDVKLRLFGTDYKYWLSAAFSAVMGIVGVTLLMKKQHYPPPAKSVEQNETKLE